MYLLLFSQHTYLVVRDAVPPSFIFCEFNSACLLCFITYFNAMFS